jgi:hypothetical protein
VVVLAAAVGEAVALAAALLMQLSTQFWNHE